MKDGVRKQVRKVHFKGPGGEDLRKVLVYDYREFLLFFTAY